MMEFDAFKLCYDEFKRNGNGQAHIQLQDPSAARPPSQAPQRAGLPPALS
jgi:hypothetical protein